MDNQDQRNTLQSGHENHGVHICHRCGWPFPNPHPSAKHRRAHKRICGSVEGYKLTDSEEHTHLTISDDEHPSDEDRRTPSPKIVKRSVKEISSGGVDERSNRSEDEFFSDAVTEFADTGFSTGMEEKSESVKELNKNEEKTIEGDLDASKSVKVDGTADTAELLNSPTESSKVYNPEVLESAASIPFQHARTEELTIALSGINGSPCDLSPSKSGTLMDAPKENTNTNVGDNRIQDLMTGHGQKSDAWGNEEDDVDKILMDVAAPLSKTAADASEEESKLQETDGKTSDPVTLDGIGESKGGKSEGSGVKMSKHDLSSEVESVEYMEASINAVQIEADSAQDIDVSSHDDLGEVCDTTGEGKEYMHVLSVATDLPFVDHPDIILEDFKDHKVLKSTIPLTLGSAEVIRSLEDDNDDTVYEESHSSFHSTKLAGSIHSSSAVMHAVEDNLEQESEDKQLIFEVPVEVKSDTSELKVKQSEDLESNGLEAPPSTSRSEREIIETNRSLQGLQCHSSENDSPQDIVPEYNAMDLSDVIPIATSTDDAVNRTTNLSGGDNADDREMVNISEFVTDGNESMEGVIEEISEKTKTTLEDADSLSVSKVDQTTNLPGGDDTGEHGKDNIELSDISGSESTGAIAEEKCAVYIKAKLESACHFSESTDLDCAPDSTELEYDTIDLGNMTQTHSISQICLEEDSQEVIKEPKSSKEGEVVADCVGAVGMGSESNQNGDAEVSEKKSEEPILKEPGHLPIDSEFAIKSFGTVEDGHCRDGGERASGIRSEPKQEEGDDKLPKQQNGVSAVDISVDSGSQTDSLEGNWGSVSVLSTQSDAPAFIDTEALSLTDSQATGKSEKSNLKMPKTAPEEQSNKSEVFEHPSFMTLVESRGGVDQKAAAPEIETVQVKSEALQAGWFPSLTNVNNESQGRKKNEEVIAKVTKWSTGKQHTPLKNLLGEANVETKPNSSNPKQTPTVIQKDETTAKNNGALATTVNSVLGSDAPAKRETGKEWNSPARYPIASKKEKKKVKGRPSWVPFVCCSSVEYSS